jgi:large subunit ribosomal protein L13
MPNVARTRTYSPRPRDIVRRWYVVDAEGAVLGRLATEVAKILRGKHKPIFAPHMDTGDHVVVVNARGVRLTAGKESSKMLIRHSGYPGGLRAIDYGRLLAERPATAVERAVRGMLPKTRLGRQMLKKLSVYEGPDHPHQAQKPAPLGLGEIPKWEGLPKPAPPPAPEARPKARSGAKTGAVQKGRAARGRATGGGAAGEATPARPARQGSRRTETAPEPAARRGRSRASRKTKES